MTLWHAKFVGNNSDNDDTSEIARLAQLVERKALNLVVVGSSPTVGILFCGLAVFVRKSVV